MLFVTVSQSLIGLHLVSHFSEGVSCQSQRRFLEEMGESSTGDIFFKMQKHANFHFW